MKYFIDTEFHEYKKKPLIGKAINTIELISIGIVSEDYCIECNSKDLRQKDFLDGCCDDCGSKMSGNIKEYYAISKDFNLKEAWNRFQLEDDNDVNGDLVKNIKKVYWIRENILKPIYKELRLKELEETCNSVEGIETYFTDKKYFKEFKRLINKYGKSNETIAEEIKNFCYNGYWFDPKEINSKFKSLKDCVDIEFYAYYADYDWVVFCWLFGRMIDLPKGFPMYCKDLKQMLDEKVSNMKFHNGTNSWKGNEDLSEALKIVKGMGFLVATANDVVDYPKQENEHNALDDAKWNKELYKFVNN